MFRPASVVRVFFNTIDLPGAGSTPTLGARLSHGFVNLLSSEWPSALVFTGTLFVYLLTVAPTLFGLDSAEFSAVAYALGVPHATGYPLYVLLGKMFTYLPFEDVAYRLNLLSAFFGAATAVVVYKTAYLVSSRAILSMAATGAFAFSFYFWASSVVAEVYTLHTFLNGMVMLLLLMWRRGGSNRLLYVSAFVWGLSFGNHMSTILMGPAFGYFVLEGLWKRRIGWRNIILLGVWFLPGLFVYAYLVWRYLVEALPWGMGHITGDGRLVRVDVTTISGMWWVLSAQDFNEFKFVHTGTDLLVEIGRIGWWMFSAFLGAGALIGGLGIYQNWKKDRGRLVFLALVFAANVIFFGTYGALDKGVMFFPAYVVWTVWMVEGLGRIFASGRYQIRVMGQARLSRMLAGARLEAVALLLPIAALMVNFSYTDVSSFTYFRDTYTKMLESFEPHALVLAYWTDSSPMFYLQTVEGIRTDVQLIDRYMIDPESERHLLEITMPHRPVYVFGYLPTLSFRYDTVVFWETSDARRLFVAVARADEGQ